MWDRFRLSESPSTQIINFHHRSFSPYGAAFRRHASCFPARSLIRSITSLVRGAFAFLRCSTAQDRTDALEFTLRNITNRSQTNSGRYQNRLVAHAASSRSAAATRWNRLMSHWQNLLDTSERELTIVTGRDHEKQYSPGAATANDDERW